MSLKRIYIFFIVLIAFSSCSKSRLDVDLSSPVMELDYANFNEALMYTDSLELMQQHHYYQKEFKDIYEYQVGYCMRFSTLDDSVFYKQLIAFKADTSIASLSKQISAVFPETSALESDINTAFSYLDYHFETIKLPKKVVFMNSLLNSGVFCTESEIGIGMERFLGVDNAYYKRLNSRYFFDWMKKSWQKEYLVRDVVEGWMQTHVLEVSDGKLIEKIIDYGKILYAIEASLPDSKKNVIMRYTEQELVWADNNTLSFWKYLVDEKLMFSNDEKIAANLLNPGPFTAGLPDQNAPARLGQFMGWKIVQQYMENNKEVSFDEMITTPYNTILQAFKID